MSGNEFKEGEKVAWEYMGKDVPGIVKEKSETEVHANSGGKDIKRKGEEGNPAYVLAMDKGDSKDGKEVAKKGSNLKSREAEEHPAADKGGDQDAGQNKENGADAAAQGGSTAGTHEGGLHPGYSDTPADALGAEDGPIAQVTGAGEYNADTAGGNDRVPGNKNQGKKNDVFKDAGTGLDMGVEYKPNEAELEDAEEDAEADLGPLDAEEEEATVGDKRASAAGAEAAPDTKKGKLGDGPAANTRQSS